jgi:hypothetical protein
MLVLDMSNFIGRGQSTAGTIQGLDQFASPVKSFQAVTGLSSPS